MQDHCNYETELFNKPSEAVRRLKQETIAEVEQRYRG